jgi:hypothetical protein
MKDKKLLIAVAFTEDYSTLVVFEYGANMIYETILEYDGSVKVQKLDWEGTLENLQEILEKFEHYGWHVCKWV